jgi:excisionase family DNA binding protein
MSVYRGHIAVVDAGDWIAPRLLTPKSATAYLSMSIDVARHMIQHRRIPYVQNGRRYLIDRLDLDRYIEKAKVGVPA